MILNIIWNIVGVLFIAVSLVGLYRLLFKFFLWEANDKMSFKDEDQFLESPCDECPFHSPDGCIDHECPADTQAKEEQP